MALDARAANDQGTTAMAHVTLSKHSWPSRYVARGVLFSASGVLLGSLNWPGLDIVQAYAACSNLHSLIQVVSPLISTSMQGARDWFNITWAPRVCFP